ncbi:MAG: alpha/beta hydrolase [Alphaproteobacteria bacterium]
MRFFARFIGLLLVLKLLVACSGSALVNALTPRSGYTVERGLAYGDGPRRKLDVYRPAGAGPDAPVLVFLYGGGWDSGDRAMYRFVGQAFADRGYVTVLPDYRVHPEVVWPEFLDDVAAAVAWARRAAPAAPLLLAGHSAGAYNAAMLALDRRWLGAHGLDPGDLTAAAGIAGPYDFLPLTSPVLKTIFGPEDRRARTQPISHVDGSGPPMLLVTGGGDTTVDPANSVRLAEHIRAAGGEAEVKIYGRLGHVAIVGALAAPLRGLAPVLDDVDAFFRRALAARGTARQDP